MRLRVQQILVATGEIVADLDLVDPAAFGVTDVVNDIPEISGLVVDKETARGLVPWRDGIAVTDVDSGMMLAAGPIIDEPADLGRDHATITAAGIEAVLAGWHVLGPVEHASGRELMHASASVFTAGSRGTIGWLMVEETMRRVGRLPIRHESPTEAGDNYQYTVQPWDFQNNNLWTLLQGLAGEQPDIGFWPATDGEWVWWDFVHGTDAQDSLPQTTMPVIDLTAVRGPVASVKPTVSAAADATRVYGTGAGQEAGQIVSAAYNDQLRQVPGVPVRERVISEGSITEAEWDRLDRLVQVEAGGDARVVQLDVELEAADPGVGVTRWRPSNLCRVEAAAWEWLAVPESGLWRMISRTIRAGSSTYGVKLQLVDVVGGVVRRG